MKKPDCLYLPWKVISSERAGNVIVTDRLGTLQWAGQTEEANFICNAVNSHEALIATLDKLSRLGNEPHYGNSDGNRIAQDALAVLENRDA